MQFAVCPVAFSPDGKDLTFKLIWLILSYVSILWIPYFTIVLYVTLTITRPLCSLTGYIL